MSDCHNSLTFFLSVLRIFVDSVRIVLYKCHVVNDIAIAVHFKC